MNRYKWQGFFGFVRDLSRSGHPYLASALVALAFLVTPLTIGLAVLFRWITAGDVEAITQLVALLTSRSGLG